MITVILPTIPTERSCTFHLPSDLEPSVDQLLSVWLGCTSWPQRFAVVRMMLESWAVERVDPDEATFRFEAGIRILTSLLEQLGETTIADQYAAATYRLAHHSAWQNAAAAWLACDNGDQFLDALLEACPAYAVAARQHLALYGVPA